MSECNEDHARLLRRAMRDAGLVSIFECADVVGVPAATLVGYAYDGREPDSHDEWDRIFAAIEAHRVKSRNRFTANGRDGEGEVR